MTSVDEPLRTSRRLALAGLLVFGSGCTGTADADAGRDAGIDCPHDVEHRAHDGSTLVFAMSSLTIDPTDSANVTHTGFDLDGLVSTDVDPMGCTHSDFLSVLDPESNCAIVRNERCTLTTAACTCRDSLDLRAAPCRGAVDNQLPTMLNTIQTVWGMDLRTSISDDVARGRVVILARVAGIDAFNEDDEVHVQLLHGFAAPGTACTTPRLGSVYQVARSSLRVGGTTEAQGAVDITGSIHGGRLRAFGNDTQAFTVMFPFQGLSFEFDLRRPMISADVGPDGAMRGNFGGWVDGDTLSNEFARVVPGLAMAVRAVVEGLVDVSIGGVCTDSTVTPSRLGGVSFGMGFDLVRVAIDPENPVVDAAAPGTCGAAGDGGADGG